MLLTEDGHLIVGSPTRYQPVHEVICADVSAHDTAWDQTANPNARGEYVVITAMDVNRTFLNDPDQPTRQDPATDPFPSPDVTIIHAAF